MTAEIPPAAGIPRLPLDEFIERLATRTPTPGGGAVLAVSTAMAASLVQMVIGYTEPEHLETVFPPSRLRGLERLGVQALRLAQQDAAAYAEYVRASRDTSPEASARRRRARAAIVAIPLAVCETAATVACAAADLASTGNPHLAGDSVIAAHQAAAAAAGAAHLVAANLGDGAADDMRGSRAGLLAARARAAVVSSAPAEGTTPPVRERR
ncbi:Glutamate formiminotransferase [Mycobacterium tuberculosis]|nr:Glutamate formiminotransferase [Mycobacterium tuberculosis]